MTPEATARGRRAPIPVHRAGRLVAALGLVVALLAAAAPAQPALAGGPFTVNTTADTHDATPGDGTCADAGGLCSLRAAIEEATQPGGATAINLPAGTYPLSLGELQLGKVSGTKIALNGTGSAAGTIIQQNDGVNRVFNIDSAFTGNVVTTIQNVTIKGGVGGAGGGGGAILDGGPGDVLNITNVIFMNNSTSALNGGAISFAGGGTLNVANSTFTNNQSPTGNGGAIHFVQTQAGSFTVTSSTFNGNSAAGGALGGQGGALDVGCSLCAPFSITGSTFTNNSAVPAGASGGQGGALMIGEGNTTVRFNRLVGNTAAAGQGSGIFHGGLGTVTATNNWWGCSTGPNTTGCETAVNAAGTLITSPFTTRFLWLPYLSR